MNIEVFTDGGAIPNPGKAGWGAVFVVDGVVKKTRSGSIPYATNNEAEITAAIRAVETFTRPATFAIISDSQYLIKSMNEWIPKRGYAGYANERLFAQLIAACEPHTITWRWVKGHASNSHNNRADQLATARIFEGATCTACTRTLDADHVDYRWATREIICGWCGEIFPMSEVYE